MEELIKQIMRIEEKAQSIVRDAKETQSELDGRILRDSERMKEDIARRAVERNDVLRQSEEADTKKRLEEIDTSAKKTLAELEEKYSKNKDIWAEQLVNGVLNA